MLSRKWVAPAKPRECEFLELCQGTPEMNDGFFESYCWMNVNGVRVQCMNYQYYLAHSPKAFKDRRLAEAKETVYTRQPVTR